jgi:hypothetical protein
MRRWLDAFWDMLPVVCLCLALALGMGLAVSSLVYPSAGGVGENCRRDGSCMSGLFCQQTTGLGGSLGYTCAPAPKLCGQEDK